MKIQIIGALVAASVLATGCATEQAQPQCLVGHGDFVVKYYPKENQPACVADLGITNTGEIFSMQKYVKTETQPSAVGTRLPSIVGTQALGTQSFRTNEDFEIPGPIEPWTGAWFNAFDRTFDTSTEASVGVGQFDMSDAPDADNYCRVTDFSFSGTATEARFPEYDADNFVFVPDTSEDAEPGDGTWALVDEPTWAPPVEGAVEVEYTFKNMAFYVTTQSPGLTFKADVTFTEAIQGGDTCTGEFTAIGMAPAFNAVGWENYCWEDGDCDPCAFDDNGNYIVGSGISPELDVACDTDIYPGYGGVTEGYCFLREPSPGVPPELPSLLTTEEVASRAQACRDRELAGG